MIPETEDTLATLDEPSTDMHAAEPDMSLDVILDVPVTLSLEVGRTRMPIRNLLQLNQGSVVELERGAGEPLDVVKGADPSGKDNILFIRNSVNGRIEARYRKTGIELNAKLHKN